MDEIKPLPEAFGSLDHLHEAARLYCEIVKTLGIDIKLMGINAGMNSGRMVKMLEEQRLIKT